MISALKPDELLRHADPKTDLEKALFKCAEYFQEEYIGYKHQAENPDLSDFDEFNDLFAEKDQLDDEIDELKEGIAEALLELSGEVSEDDIANAIKILENLK
jgi:hypothetical protein